jgi:hypothetical protein
VIRRSQLACSPVGVFLVPLVFVLAFYGTARARNPKTGVTTPSADQAPAPVLVAEKGKFRVLVNGKEAGKEEFEISPNGDVWVAGGSAEVQSPDGTTMHISSMSRLRPDGTPVHYEWSTQGAKKASAAVEFSAGTATIELHLENAKPFTQQFFFNSPRVVILDNNLFHQYAILARLYDWQKKGPQTFSVLVPQSMAPGTVTVEATGKQDGGGVKLDLLRVHSEDLEINLYLDGLRLVRIVSPASGAEVARE